ncbi:MAG: nucleotide exchange factor GrpE [Pirellulaceae bacterium]
MSTNAYEKPHMNDDELAALETAAKSVEDAASARGASYGGQGHPTDGEGPDVSATDSESVSVPDSEPTGDLARLQTELDETRRKNARLQAELENFRKRMMRTMDEERRYAALPLLRDLLPVIDNLQRALSAAEQHETASGLLEGVKMVADQLTAILQRHHCEPIPAAGAAFDPHLHEAIAQHPSTEHQPGHVSFVAQVGYQLHDRVIRPAQVIVAAPRETAEPAPDALYDPEI